MKPFLPTVSLQEPSASSPWRWRSPAPCRLSSRRCLRTRRAWKAGLWAADPAAPPLAAAVPVCPPALPKAAPPPSRRSRGSLLDFPSSSPSHTPALWRGAVGTCPSKSPPSRSVSARCGALTRCEAGSGPAGRWGASERTHRKHCLRLPLHSPLHLSPKNWWKTGVGGFWRIRGAELSWAERGTTGQTTEQGLWTQTDLTNTRHFSFCFSLVVFWGRLQLRDFFKRPHSSKTLGLFIFFPIKKKKQISYRRYINIYIENLRNYCDGHVQNRISGWTCLLSWD